MIWIVGAIALVSIVLNLFFFVELRHVRLGYEQIYQLMERDRDAARTEATTYRETLFPQLRRAAEAKSPIAIPNTPAFPTTKPRIPTRLWLKQQARAHNSQQSATDSMARGIGQAQAKEQA